MLLVIDANVIVAQVLAGGDPGPLVGHQLIAPALIRPEALSALSEMTYRGEIEPGPALAAVDRLEGIPITVERPPGLDRHAWEIARSLGWAKTYDAEYVALARLRSVPLVTLDNRLRRGAGHVVEIIRLVDL